MKPNDVTYDSYAKYNEDFNKKDPKFKVIMLDFQNANEFLLKDTLQIGQKKFLLLIKLKIQSREHMRLVT